MNEYLIPGHYLKLAASKEKDVKRKADILNPNVAKVGELQSQGAKGEAVVIYCEPFATRDLKFSGFPEG